MSFKFLSFKFCAAALLGITAESAEYAKLSQSVPFSYYRSGPTTEPPVRPSTSSETTQRFTLRTFAYFFSLR